jgi:hypothetical protein
MKTNNNGPFWQEAQIPDGVYEGMWGGYEVRMKVNGNAIKFNTNSGVRGLNIPVTVTVTNGEAEVKTNA